MDFVSAVCLFAKKVIWKDPDELPIIDQDKQRFLEMLSVKIIYLSDKEDRLLWVLGKNGNYLVKEAYILL